MLVPNLGDEQPRIVYDAYSQAVPVLASATPGLKACVEEGVTGRFFAPGSPSELAQQVGPAARQDARLDPRQCSPHRCCIVSAGAVLSRSTWFMCSAGSPRGTGFTGELVLRTLQEHRGELAPMRVRENTVSSFTVPGRFSVILVKSPACSTHPDPSVSAQ